MKKIKRNRIAFDIHMHNSMVVVFALFQYIQSIFSLLLLDRQHTVCVCTHTVNVLFFKYSKFVTEKIECTALFFLVHFILWINQWLMIHICSEEKKKAILWFRKDETQLDTYILYIAYGSVFLLLLLLCSIHLRAISSTNIHKNANTNYMREHCYCIVRMSRKLDKRPSTASKAYSTELVGGYWNLLVYQVLDSQ